MRKTFFITHVILLLVANVAVAATSVTWSIDETINRDENSLSWVSPTAIDAELINYQYNYEITKVEATVRPFLFDITVDVTDDIAASFALTGDGVASSLPVTLLSESINDASTGTTASVLIRVNHSGYGQAVFSQVMLGQADVPLVGMTDIRSLRVQATIEMSGVLPPPGDFNHDGLVDLADYNKWVTDYGKTGSAGAASDANGNNVVDAADYTVWRDNYSQQSAAVALSVPEPASLLLVLSAGALFFCRRSNGHIKS